MEFIHLTGAEQVQNAANSMREAAETMKRAASEIQSTFEQQRIFLNQWLTDFESILRSGN